MKGIERAIKEIEGLETETSQNFPHGEIIEKEIVLSILNFNRLDEPETLSKEWIREHLTDGHNVETGDAVVFVEDLQNLLVLKQEEVNQAYKDGYEKGKEHVTKKEKETVASVLKDFLVASAKFRMALGMEVEEAEELEE